MAEITQQSAQEVWAAERAERLAPQERAAEQAAERAVLVELVQGPRRRAQRIAGWALLGALAWLALVLGMSLGLVGRHLLGGN